MTEFEQRLTDEFSKLAAQYAREQTQLAAQVESLERASATVGRALRTGAESAHRVGEYTRRARREIDQQLQGTDGRFNRAPSVIHVEVEQKRKDGDRPDRVEGRIESLLQSRARSLDR